MAFKCLDSNRRIIGSVRVVIVKWQLPEADSRVQGGREYNRKGIGYCHGRDSGGVTTQRDDRFNFLSSMSTGFQLVTDISQN